MAFRPPFPPPPQGLSGSSKGKGKAVMELALTTPPPAFPEDEELLDYSDEADISIDEQPKADVVKEGLPDACADPGEQRTVLTVNDFEEDDFFIEDGEQYEKLGWAVTRHYNARDKPPKAALVIPDDDKYRLDLLVPALVVNHTPSSLDNEQQSTIIGSTLHRGPRSTISLAMALNSQHPAFRLQITDAAEGSPGNVVSCCIFVDAIQRGLTEDHGSLELAIRHGNDPLIGACMSAEPPLGRMEHVSIAEMRHLYGKGDLMEIRMKLYDPRALPTQAVNQRGPAPSRVIWEGIDLQRQQDILQRSQAQRSDLTEFETIVAHLLTASEISILRYWPASAAQGFSQFRDWVMASASMVTEYGNHWYYQLESQRVFGEAPQSNIYTSSAQLHRLEKPRHMTKTWELVADKNGNQRAVPLECESFTFGPREQSFPDAKCVAFAYRLAIERERRHQFRVLNSSFTRDSELPIYEPIKLRLIHDPSPSDRQRDAILTIARSFDSQIRFKGVDIPWLVLKAPMKIVDTGLLAKELESLGSDGAANAGRTAFDEIIDAWRLNGHQRSLALKSSTTTTGVTLGSGPPGTGKSRTGAATAAAHVYAGKALAKQSHDPTLERPVIVTAASNAACDSIMDKFLGHDTTRGLLAVRYRGSMLYDNGHVAMEQGENAPMAPTELDQAHDDPARAALGDLAEDSSSFGREDPHAEYGFFRQLEKYIAMWASSTSLPTPHIMASLSAKYLQDKADLSTPGSVPTEDKHRMRIQHKKNEAELGTYFLRNCVDVVFSTNSTAAHGPLRYSFQPKVLISDEAATCSAPDCATPLAAFMASLELVVLFGDHEQQKPRVASRGFNEMDTYLATSLLESAIGNTGLQDSHVGLQIQHRMHPELSRLPSKLFYKQLGGLIDHDDVKKDDSALWITLADFMKTLWPAWNGHRRFAYDVSGPMVESLAPPNGGTSRFNEWEAALVAEFIRKALSHLPPPGGRPLEPQDFLVLSPYFAQCALIKRQLAVDLIGEQASGVRVASIRSVQGGEGNIVLLSWCRNSKGNPLDFGFIHEKDGINIALTRARESLIMFGNFRAWLTQMLGGDKMLNTANNRFAAFAALLQDLWKHQDVGPVDGLSDRRGYRGGRGVSAGGSGGPGRAGSGLGGQAVADEPVKKKKTRRGGVRHKKGKHPHAGEPRGSSGGAAGAATAS